eukprot:scaffold7192_cov135-Isochrysis_galbana.AAC.3
MSNAGSQYTEIAPAAGRFEPKRDATASSSSDIARTLKSRMSVEVPAVGASACAASFLASSADFGMSVQTVPRGRIESDAFGSKARTFSRSARASRGER